MGNIFVLIFLLILNSFTKLVLKMNREEVNQVYDMLMKTQKDNPQETKKHGYGEFTSVDDKKYVGFWKDGMLEGDGEVSTSRGERYIGEWVDNKKDGVGEEMTKTVQNI